MLDCCNTLYQQGLRQGSEWESQLLLCGLGHIRRRLGGDCVMHEVPMVGTVLL